MPNSFPWANIYIQTLCETDKQTLSELVPRTEVALFLRELEISTSANPQSAINAPANLRAPSRPHTERF